MAPHWRLLDALNQLYLAARPRALCVFDSGVIKVLFFLQTIMGAAQGSRVCEYYGSTSFKRSPILPDSMQTTELFKILRSNALPPTSVASSLQDG
jgi:hypothetical protein